MTRKHLERSLPGAELVEQGLADLAKDRVSDFSLLVLIAAPRLRRLGIEVPDRAFPRPYEHQLYARLAERLGTDAHSQYNALIRRIVSYSRALEREKSRINKGFTEGNEGNEEAEQEIRNPKSDIRNKFE